MSVSIYLIGGVVLTLMIVAVVVQGFLAWSTKRGWFKHEPPPQ